MTEPTDYYREKPGNANVKTALVGGALAALLVSNIYLFVQIHDMKADSAKARESIEAEVENLKENSSQVVATNRKHLEKLNEDLDSTRRQANLAASQAKKESLTYTEQQAKRLEQQQEASVQKVNGELSQVKDAATSANAKIDNVNGEVTTVKSMVETKASKSDLDKTILDLKKVTGDLGVTSGYVATNGKELDALKRLGERNYVEFKLPKGKAPQRVGEVSLLLKKADQKHNRFTFELTADDKKTEKKDKTINEPIQFYMSRAKQPYEIIVNSVQHDMIVGYLAEPKVQSAR